MIKEIEDFKTFIRGGTSLKNCTFQQLDFRRLKISWQALEIDNTFFLGCQFDDNDRLVLLARGAVIIDNPGNVPYTPLRKELYTWQELLAGDAVMHDLEIYQHFDLHKHNTNINEALWQRIHDHAIDDALREYIEMSDHGKPRKKCVGMMGGHSVARDSRHYHLAAMTAKKLTEAGYFIVSGGGPGIMEAANLGAFMAHKSDNSLKDAIQHMSSVPHYTDPNFTEVSVEMYQRYRDAAGESLAIPTWFYGHEPSNVFATQIAKYFSNSIREDTLLAICISGVVYAPGSAGTVQEIFMDAAQNHYVTYGYISPMIFLDRDHYEYQTGLYPMIRKLSRGRVYHDMLANVDSPEEVLAFIQKHPPATIV